MAGTLVLCPTAVERAAAAAAFKDGTAVREVGVGKVRSAAAAAVLIAELRPQLVVVVGVAGSAHPHVRVGDTVLASALIEHDWVLPPAFQQAEWSPREIAIAPPILQAAMTALLESRRTATDPWRGVHQGRIGSGDQVVDAALVALRSTALLTEFHAVDMESAAVGYAVGHAARRDGLPRLLVVRTVGDHLSAGRTLPFRRAATLAAQDALIAVEGCRSALSSAIFGE